MDSSAAAYVDGFGGGGGGGDETCDLFVGVEGESGELAFSWGADVESGTTGLGDHGRVHMDMETPETEEQERKKRQRWTLTEHRLFLMGYKQHGRKWTKISRQYIPWKTPTQLSSHAQKYFIRQKTPARNWIRDTVNNVSDKDLTSGDDSHSSPKQQPPLAAASLPRPGGGPSTVQQSLHATMSQTGVNGSSSMPLPGHDFIRFSSPVGQPAPAQQSFGGVSMQGANIGGPALHRTNIGSWSSSHMQPFPHLGGTEWNYSNPMVHQEFVPWNQMPQLVAASPGYYSPAPPMPWNDNMDLEPPEQHPFTDEEGSLDFDEALNDYLAYYWRYL